MAQNNKEVLEQEELGAILVLGVIGSFIALNSTLHNFELLPNLSLHTLVITLEIYWGMYVFLMVIGISGRDLINERIAFHFRVCASIGFVFGIATIFAIPVTIFFDWLILPWNLPSYITYLTDIGVQLAVSLVIAWKIRSETLDDAIGESHRDLFPDR